MNKLPQSEFTWERWGGRDFGLTDVLKEFDADSRYFELLPNITCLGYIESRNLQVRPRTRGVTLMIQFEDDEKKYWIHCPEFGMEKILEGKNED